MADYCFIVFDSYWKHIGQVVDDNDAFRRNRNAAVLPLVRRNNLPFAPKFEMSTAEVGEQNIQVSSKSVLEGSRFVHQISTSMPESSKSMNQDSTSRRSSQMQR